MDISKTYALHLSPRIVFGVGTAQQVGVEVRALGVSHGLIVTDGTSTLDGQAVDTCQARRLLSQFGIGANGFSVVLIGKDGGEKFRVNGVPDLPSIYAVIDGMPMRQREMGADRC